MKIENLLDDFIRHLKQAKIKNLNDIVCVTKQNTNFPTILMYIKNSEKSLDAVVARCNALLTHRTSDSDLLLAAFIVLGSGVDSDKFDKIVSFASSIKDDYPWSRAMALTYLLQKRVSNETIHQSA